MELPPMPILIPMSPDIVAGPRNGNDEVSKFITSDFEGSCEKAVFLWELMEDTFPMPLIPEKEVINPAEAPEQDSSSSILDIMKGISSGIFVRGQEINKPAEWQLSLLNKHDKASSEVEMQLVLKCEQIYIQPAVPVLGKFSCDVVDEEGVPVWSAGDVYESDLKPFYAGTLHTMSLGLKTTWQDKKKQLMPENILRIRLRLNIYKELRQEASKTNENESYQPTAAKRGKMICGMSSAMTGLLGSMDNFWRTRDQSGDITIVCDTQEIKAHRFVLSGQSEVFKGMLDSIMDTKEKSTSVIKVDDISPEIMTSFLEFLYFNRMARFDWNNVDHICSLVYAADKYWIAELMTKCYQHLIKLMNLKNFSKIAKVTFLYNSENQFKDEVQHFYFSNQIQLSGVDSFRKFADEDFEEFHKMFFYNS